MAPGLTGPPSLSARNSAAAPLAELIGEGLACRRGERLVFAGLDFRLPPGGALVLTGANGSGKSSLLRLVAGLLGPAAGRLMWGTTVVAANLASHHARLHYVGHQDALKLAMTPREILAFWAVLRGIRQRVRRRCWTKHSPLLPSMRSPIGRAAGSRPGSGGGWRLPACWWHRRRCGCSTSRRQPSTTTARQGSKRLSAHTARRAAWSWLRPTRRSPSTQVPSWRSTDLPRASTIQIPFSLGDDGRLSRPVPP